MKKMTIATFLFFSFFCVAATVHSREEKTNAIKLSIGSNIVETGKNSGIPSFNVSNLDGFIQYKATQIPADIPIIFEKAGFGLKIEPVLSLTLYADRKRTPDDLVNGVRVSIGSTNIALHIEAQKYIDRLKSQFRAGGWKRHLAVYCPAVTGRSSLLNVVGELDSNGCPFDPDFQIAPDDWPKLFRTGGSYEWIGDGILATLTAGYREYGGDLTYRITLTLDDYQTKLEVTRENDLREEQDGDAKGWNTSAKAVEAERETQARVKILEANAIKRGDTVIPR